ncbi:MAG: FliM/FliN family flagellar motor switch protein [Campylobacterota bacterium]|nr:FliM/FliN family flagellar motor switch protein [Campylobacterota bacterium]
MASDISNIIKSEISSTLESLLSVSSSVKEVVLVDTDDLKEEQCIKVGANFEFNGNSSSWNYYIPTKAATQFEYLMLGGVTDLKDSIDDEITDAIKEIVSTMSGSMVTSINAQGFDDISGLKFTLLDAGISKCDEISSSNTYKFIFSLNDDNFDIVIEFDDNISSYVSKLTAEGEVEQSEGSTVEAPVKESIGNSLIGTLLGEESVDNLKLLFDIKMRLSVRLGTKICLLRDVISWDIGEIIELSQMTNEPLDILVNGNVVGKGEAVIVDGKFGVKIKSIGSKKIN